MNNIRTDGQQSRKRVSIVMIVTAVLFLLLICRLAYIQLIKGDWLQQMALENRTSDVLVEAKRGTIYDCNNNELVTSVSADSFYAIPSQIKDKQAAARVIADNLSLKYEEVLAKVSQDSDFVWLQRKADFSAAEALKKAIEQDELNVENGTIDEPVLDGIEWVEESTRNYVHSTLASHVLGFVGTDNQGLAGVEAEYNRTLKGTEGRIVIESDAAGREIPQATHHYYEAESGNNLVLTIDQNIQYYVEQEMDNIVETYKPESATIIVMDPDNGDILGLGIRPTYDPNNWQEYDSEIWNSNPAVSFNYEPGSTFKIVVASAAMEENVVDDKTVFDDPGYTVIGDTVINCWLTSGHGKQSFAEIVQNSCNTGFIQLGLNYLGVDRLYKYFNAFGFGQLTDVDLPGEETGILYSQDSVTDINLAAMSIGQSIAVTPIQLITAASCVANDGFLMKPRIVKAITDDKGKVIQEIDPTIVKQVVSKDTANKLCEYLENVVLYGSGTAAYIDGYRVGGKTGTAEVAENGVYIEGEYVSSFVGIAPVNDPQVVILVVVNKPTKNGYYGSEVAAPIFKNVAWNVLRYMKVPQQAESDETTDNTIEVPDVIDEYIEDARDEIVSEGLIASYSGEGTIVTDQTPEAGSSVAEGSTVMLTIGKSDDADNKTTVPNLSGYRIKEAGELLEAMGLDMIPQGSGVAVAQSIAAGKTVESGTAITVTFKTQ